MIMTYEHAKFTACIPTEVMSEQLLALEFTKRESFSHRECAGTIAKGRKRSVYNWL